ncbi:MAG: AgmX/PglI C-terminal domain-containing protein [Anaeromyxobacter sp.]|nr:AgmX/PglI C-terminal domain-containing protein [Anaeromyxobacter sp.]MBL0274609.1 AgmX/PglI C-terminal domain-containing protein [Anaeromyxobacter sp.]
MKFVCDRCGKKYATAEDPSPGKVYKLKCRACGHLIVVKAQAGTSTTIPALSSSEAAGAVNAAQPPAELEIEIEPESASSRPAQGSVDPVEGDRSPEPQLVDDSAIVLDQPPLPPEVASAADGAVAMPDTAAAPLEPPLPAAPPPEKDELADFAAAAAEVMAAPTADQRPGFVDLFADGITGERPARPADDAFTAAARASLPDGYVGSGAESFVAPPAEPPRPAPEPPKVSPPRPAARPPEKKGGSPLVFVGLGVVLIGAITAVAIGRGGKKDEPQPPPPVAIPATAPQRAEPEPAPPAPRVVEPAPEPARPAPVEKKVEPRPEPPRPKVVERRPEPKPEPKPEPVKVAVAPPPPPPPEEPRVETREVQLPDAESALTPEVVQKVITANRKAFASCIASAGEDVKLDGRKVVLKLTVNANGAVTYPTLDDVTLNPTEMGQCLKSAARLMIFPKFKGDPFHVEVPLTLSN